MDCVFCNILDGKEESYKIFEDDKLLAVIDKFPASPGHVLLIPKHHLASLTEFPQELIAHFGKISERMSSIFFQNIKCDGVTCMFQEGKFAAQKSTHQIMHVIPRFEGDDLKFNVFDSEVSLKDFNDFFSSYKARK